MKYRKNVTIRYDYIASPEAEQAVVGVFDDIFSRLAAMYSTNTYANFSQSTVELFGFVLEAKEKGIVPQFRLLNVH